MASLQIEKNGAILCAEMHGATTARLVAFTHGGWMNRQMFEAQIRPVVNAGYRVLSWDLRGHGESSPQSMKRPTVADMSADLISILDAAGDSKPAVLVGQSLGGMIAQHAALTNPARVAGVVAIGSPCINPSDRKAARRTAAIWRTSGVVTRVLRRSLVISLMAKGVAVEPDIQEYVRSAASQQALAEFRWVAQAPLGAGRGLEGRSISVPVLIVRGDRDDTGAGKLAAATARNWTLRDPNAQYVEISGAGHQTNQDRSERFNEVLIKFLPTAFHDSAKE